MKPYKEFQFGWLIVLTVVPVQLLLNYLHFNEQAINTLSKYNPLIMNGFLVLIYTLFYGMTTVVDKNKITVSYGIGIIKKVIKTDTVTAIDVVTNPWYYGWGIRLIPNGWLYNINGLNAIELKFRDKKGIIRIGTREALHLKEEIKLRHTEQSKIKK